MKNTPLLLLLLLSTANGLPAATDPAIDSVSVDNNDRRIVYLHFADPLPAVKEIKDPSFWLIFSKSPAGVRRQGVAGVDTSIFNEEEAAKSGREAASVEHSIVLQLTTDIPADAGVLDVTLVNGQSIVHIAPAKLVPPSGSKPAPSVPIVRAAKNKNDSDIYFNGGYTGVVDGDPVWDIDAFAGYMKAVRAGSRYWGKFGFYGQVRTKQSKKADPNSFLTYLVYQRVIGSNWWGPFQAPYLNLRFAGWEFDRSGNQLNFVNSPVLTLPFRLSGKLSGPLQPGLSFPHMTLQLGAEFVDVQESVLPAAKNWHTRGLLGATFSTAYAPEQKLFQSIELTSSYQIRLPSAPEIFFDDRFAPVDPATGKKGDTPPLLGTQPRHSIDTKLTYMFSDWAGTSFEYTYGSVPPLFNKTGHSFSLGLTFTLKQSSYGRYSILKP